MDHQGLEMAEKETAEHKKVESEERGYNMQQIKDALQTEETEGFDDALLDPKIQEKILEDLEQQHKENKQRFTQTGKANITYPKLQRSASESQSRASGHEYHQQPCSKKQISHQDPRAQCIYSEDIHSQGMTHHGMDQQEMRQQSISQQKMGCQGISQQGMGQQGIYPQSTFQQSTNLPPQDFHSQGMFYQGFHQQGMSQQDLHSQGVYQQEWPHQAVYPQEMHSQEMFQQRMSQQDIHPQGLQPQGISQSNMPQPGPYQRNAPQSYHSQQYNLFPNNGNLQGENPSYPMNKQPSTEFHQILRAETNVPNNTLEPNRQMEVSRNMPRLEVGDAVQRGSNPISYGTIKWIGEFSGSHEKIAGVEMVKKLCTT